MKLKNCLRLFLSISTILLLHANCLAQDAATIADAKAYYYSGLAAYNSKDYKKAIENCLISVSEVPNAITFYLLTNAYAKNGNPKAALLYADITLKKSPPLVSKYYEDLEKIKKWAKDIVNQPAVQPPPVITNDEENINTGEALTSAVAPGFTVAVPSQGENPFSEQEANPAAANSTFQRKFIFVPGQPQQKIPVVDNNNNLVGYINFYGFKGGQNIGNGKSIATSFILTVSSVADAANTASDMLTDAITFNATELNIGSVKSKTVGMLTFKATILEVQKPNPNPNPAAYYLGSVKVLVNTYPRVYMHMQPR